MQPAFRRLHRGPPSIGALAGEQPGSQAFAAQLPGFATHNPLWRPKEILEHLPANSTVSSEQPLDDSFCGWGLGLCSTLERRGQLGYGGLTFSLERPEPRQQICQLLGREALVIIVAHWMCRFPLNHEIVWDKDGLN